VLFVCKLIAQFLDFKIEWFSFIVGEPATFSLLSNLDSEQEQKQAMQIANLIKTLYMFNLVIRLLFIKTRQIMDICKYLSFSRFNV